MDKQKTAETIINVLATATKRDPGEFNIDMSMEEIGLKSIQLISTIALLEDKLGDAPNFRKLMGMEKVSDILEYYEE